MQTLNDIQSSPPVAYRTSIVTAVSVNVNVDIITLASCPYHVVRSVTIGDTGAE